MCIGWCCRSAKPEDLAAFVFDIQRATVKKRRKLIIRHGLDGMLVVVFLRLFVIAALEGAWRRLRLLAQIAREDDPRHLASKFYDDQLRAERVIPTLQ